MTTHVFIVDAITFPFHLEHLFAGTGAKEHFIDFNNSPCSQLHHTTENMLVDMIADSGRVRRGDQIIFYLQQDYGRKIFEGKFFGVFKAVGNGSFLDNNSSEQFLKEKLGKLLTFRTLISPHKVYPEGVTEWEALDEIQNLTSPNQMLWSLIYRKLKGNRGNTMITHYEAERLLQLIRNKNGRKELDYSGNLLSFDPKSEKIISLEGELNSYKERQEEINLLPRLLGKYKEGKSFEAHLQAYITQNIGLGINESLDSVVLDSGRMEWLGNEVSCGVGMQRIDVMPSITREKQRVLIPIELKSVEANEQNVIQIQRYVDWIQQYYTPNRPSDIQPILLAKKIHKKETKSYRNLIDSFHRFNEKNNANCELLKLIEFFLRHNGLQFELISY